MLNLANHALMDLLPLKKELSGSLNVEAVSTWNTRSMGTIILPHSTTFTPHCLTCGTHRIRQALLTQVKPTRQTHSTA